MSASTSLARIRRKFGTRLAVLVSVVVPVLGSACGADGPEVEGGSGLTTTAETPTTVEIPTTADTTTTAGTSADPQVAPEATTGSRTLTVDGQERTYRLHVPDGLPAGEEVPLIIALHGGLGSGEQFARSSDLDTLADVEGIITVFPDGLSRRAEGGGRTWNGGYCCGFAQASDVDDVAFIEAVVGQVSDEYPVDPARVGAMGHSNGAIMAYRLACEASSTFAAVVAVAGSLGVDDCDPDDAVAVLHIHGDSDQNHPLEGGVGPKSIIPGEFSFRPATDAVETWAELDNCDPAPALTDDGALTVTRWSGCDDGTEVILTVIADAGHPWPGGEPNPLTEERTGPPTQALDATTEAVAFLLAHPRGSATGR